MKVGVFIVYEGTYDRVPGAGGRVLGAGCRDERVISRPPAPGTRNFHQSPPKGFKWPAF